MAKIGLNIRSLLPWSAFPPVDLLAKYFAVPLAEKMTEKIGGIDFWQVLPLKGVTAQTLSKAGVDIKYLEAAWNPTTMWRHLVGKAGMTGQRTRAGDFVFFPQPDMCNRRVKAIMETFPSAILIGPDIYRIGIDGPLQMVEINPEMGLPAEALAQFWAPMYATEQYFPNGKSIVLDLKHIRRERCGCGKNPLHGWGETYRYLLPFTGLIHVQPLNSVELRLTINTVETELVRMVKQAVDEGFEGDFVIEVPPNLLGAKHYLNRKDMTFVLYLFRTVLEEAVN